MSSSNIARLTRRDVITSDENILSYSRCRQVKAYAGSTSSWTLMDGALTDVWLLQLMAIATNHVGTELKGRSTGHTYLTGTRVTEALKLKLRSRQG